MESEIVELPISDLKPHPRNPRKGDVDAIAQSIRMNGFFGVIVVQRSTMQILAGNHRWQAARKVGLTRVPVMLLDVDDVAARKIMLADNRTSDFASYDQDELAGLLKSVLADDTLIGTGFDAGDVDKLLGQVVDEPNEKVRKRNLEPFHACFWLVKAPISLQGKITTALTEAVGSLEGVEIASATN
ncbi:MAG: hypothetical protein EBZ91_08325 [Gammaproteobacteria bacterium]|nr:hypothetical protein [Gammaproteobacteria bacterium]